MPEIEKKLNEMGYQLTEPRGSAVGNFVPAVRTGNLVYTAGTGPGLPDGGLLHVGKLGAEISIEQGYDCARLTMLNLLSNLKGEIGDLDKVKRVVKLLCMVNAAPQFTQTPQVANGASDLLVELFGEKGRHARSAVGMSTLPGNMPIEIEMIVEVED
ncbi:MAG: RidA family protein [Chloroflexota bacterium]|nr:RidA family protein [Chloroflexota bacterium]